MSFKPPSTENVRKKTEEWKDRVEEIINLNDDYDYLKESVVQQEWWDVPIHPIFGSVWIIFVIRIHNGKRKLYLELNCDGHNINSEVRELNPLEENIEKFKQQFNHMLFWMLHVSGRRADEELFYRQHPDANITKMARACQ